MRISISPRQVLINAETVHVGTGPNLSGLPTYQELANRREFSADK